MNSKLKDRFSRIDWRYLIVTTIIASTTFEICALIYNFAQGESNNAVSANSWIWYTLIFILFFLYLLYKKINYKDFFFVLVLLGICSSLIWMFIPKRFDIPSNYAGIQTRLTLNEYQTSGGNSRTDATFEYESSLDLGYVFEKSDPSFIKTVKGKAKWNEFVHYDSFIFWHTAMAYGYNPERLEKYYGSDSIIGKLKLFFTVGPISILECFIKGIYYEFIFFILAHLIWYRHNYCILW